MASSGEHPGQKHTIYCAEGSIHLYSTGASALTPADLYRVRQSAELRQLLSDCNIYLIAARPRIFIDPDDFNVVGGMFHGHFIVQRTTGVVRLPFAWRLPGDPQSDATYRVGVDCTGTHVELHIRGHQSWAPAHVIVTQAQSALQDIDTDLEVLYVGQGIGQSRQRSALDRLLNHSTLQRILAEMSTFHPNAEVLILLYRFEHSKTWISTGGDLTAEPSAGTEEESAHLKRMGSVVLSRHERIALAEAGLIRHFQPRFNVQIKNNNFSGLKKIKVLDRLLKKDLVGLIVEICSANIRARLKTASTPPLDLDDYFAPEVRNGSRLAADERREWIEQLHSMAHTHYASFPLTTPAERDTFMHGVRWHGAEERMEFLRKTGQPRP